MPKITDLQIQKNNKTRANVYVDGHFAFGAEMVTVMKLGLKIGAEVSEERLRLAVFDSERSVAFQKAADYLGRAMRTRKQMTDYLLKKGYSQEVTQDVLQRLCGYKYVDDEAYCEAYVRQNGQGKGARRIRAELLERGISAEMADRHSDLDEETQRRGAQQVAHKYMKNKPCDVKTMQKLQRYLLSRGYGYETVLAVVRSYREDCSDD